mmetsp:Transcript_37337/g.92319  ORF Transcript_37337/g.92319 Transcript_37337/m.92319 type:complete len:289 (+) Transcript_37337:1189-2055(+)
MRRQGPADAVRVQDDPHRRQGALPRLRPRLLWHRADRHEGAHPRPPLRARREEGPVHQVHPAHRDLHGPSPGRRAGRAVREHVRHGWTRPVHPEERHHHRRARGGGAHPQSDEVLRVARRARRRRVQELPGPPQAGGGPEASVQVRPHGAVPDRGDWRAHRGGCGRAPPGDLPEGPPGGLHGRRRDPHLRPRGVFPGVRVRHLGPHLHVQVPKQAQPPVLPGHVLRGGPGGGDRRRRRDHARRAQGARALPGGEVRVGQGPVQEDLVLRPRHHGPQHDRGHVQGCAVP